MKYSFVFNHKNHRLRNICPESKIGFISKVAAKIRHSVTPMDTDVTLMEFLYVSIHHHLVMETIMKILQSIGIKDHF